MRDPLVHFLLARYDEEDPAHIDSTIEEMRDRVTELECHLIVGDEPFDRYRSKRDVAWTALKLAALPYRDHPAFRGEWHPWPDSGTPRTPNA